MSNSTHEPMTWMIFAVLTVSMWGLYGVLLHKGVHAMGDPEYGRYKAYLFVGLAYFIFAVAAPAVLLWLSNANWSFTGGGMFWSLVAGTVGAFGAFGILLAFGAGGRPAVVMSLVFAGAPILTACVAITLEGNWGNVRWQFFAGILIAIVGAVTVTMNRPPPPQVDHAEPASAAEVSAAEPAARQAAESTSDRAS